MRCGAVGERGGWGRGGSVGTVPAAGSVIGFTCGLVASGGGGGGEGAATGGVGGRDGLVCGYRVAAPGAC